MTVRRTALVGATMAVVITLATPAAFADGLTTDATNYTFVCDGNAGPLGQLSGAAPGESVTMTSPQVSVLSGTADSAGNLALSWQCDPSDIGSVWDVTAQTSSGMTTFSITGTSPDAGTEPGTSEESPAPTALTDSVFYDREAAAAYATSHWNSRNLFNSDCTWFASQALWAGGLPQTTEWGAWAPDGVFGSDLEAAGKALVRAGISPVTPINPPRTATIADELPRFLEAHGYAQIVPITWSDNTASGAQVGDLIAYDWNHGADGTYDHIAVVTSVDANGYPSVSQHSEARLNRYWSWSPGANSWIESQHQPAESEPRAYLVHITY